MQTVIVKFSFGLINPPFFMPHFIRHDPELVTRKIWPNCTWVMLGTYVCGHLYMVCMNFIGVHAWKLDSHRLHNPLAFLATTISTYLFVAQQSLQLINIYVHCHTRNSWASFTRLPPHSSTPFGRDSHSLGQCLAAALIRI